MDTITAQYQLLSAAGKSKIQDQIQELSTYFGQEGYELVQKKLTEFGTPNDALSTCEHFVLATYFHYFSGIMYLFQGNYAAAREAMVLVYSNASQIADLQELSVESDMFCSYFTGVIEVQEGNIQKGLDNLQHSHKNLEHHNNYAKYQQTLESITPDILFISAVHSLQKMDYALAKNYSNQAAEKALSIVKNYGHQSDYTVHFYTGLAHYYRSYIDFHIAERDIAAFYFNSILLKNNVAAQGFEKAAQSFEAAVAIYAVATSENLYYANQVFYVFAVVQTQLAAALTARLQQKIVVCDFDELRTQLFNIQVFIDKIILQQVHFLHQKEMLEMRINQLEKWCA
jgi:hypothetical protein